jgi:hypothetical protein
MSEADGTIPTTVTRKRKRGSGFKFSTTKAIERSRLSKEIAKDRVLEIGSVMKALTYPSELLSEIGIVDLAGCSTKPIWPASLQLVDEDQEDWTDASIGNALSIVECFNKVSISDMSSNVIFLVSFIYSQ